MHLLLATDKTLGIQVENQPREQFREMELNESSIYSKPYFKEQFTEENMT